MNHNSQIQAKTSIQVKPSDLHTDVFTDFTIDNQLVFIEWSSLWVFHLPPRHNQNVKEYEEVHNDKCTLVDIDDTWEIVGHVLSSIDL